MTSRRGRQRPGDNRMTIDPRPEYITQLHKAYTQGGLRILAGAGVSIPSGFPAWDTLNQRLLLKYVEQEHRNDALWKSQLPDLAAQPYELFGRDGAAQFVRIAAHKGFFSLLAQTLYNGREISDLPINTLQYQIAAMAHQARVLTFNFDPMLEIAWAKLRGDATAWGHLRWPTLSSAEDARPSGDVIDHVHGWIDPDGTHGGEIVFTESDYFELTARKRARANRCLSELLNANGAVLTIGVSLTDPNLRRLLYLQQARKVRAGLGIYTLQRQTSRVLEEYGTRHWESLDLKPLIVQEFDAIPTLLRDIVWGISPAGTLPNWVSPSVGWRQQSLPDSVLFSDNWQLIAYQALRGLKYRLNTMFSKPREERINLGLFVPLTLPGHREVTLSQVVSSRSERTGTNALEHAAKRSFRITTGNEEGVAGLAFVVGNTRQVSFSNPTSELGLTKESIMEWASSGASYRDWRSVLAVPLLDTPSWLPVAVVTLTSNFPDPFWTRFGPHTDALEAELYDLLRRTARWLLVDFRADVS